MGKHRFNTYRREIAKNFNWKGITADAKANVYDSEGHVYLGSVQSLTPSGKIYAPFAHGNVDGCNHCGGKGSVVNRKGNPAEFARLEADQVPILRDLLDNHGAWCNGEWPADKAAALEALRAEAARVRPTHACSWCDGLGSHEAAKDEDWREALEAVAEKYGLCVSTPDGAAGDDIFVCDPDYEAPKAAEGRWYIVWDNGGASGTFPQRFDTEEEAEAWGKEWADEMNAADDEPEAEHYTYEVFETEDGE